jgi:hypothetical protein
MKRNTEYTTCRIVQAVSEMKTVEKLWIHQLWILLFELVFHRHLSISMNRINDQNHVSAVRIYLNIRVITIYQDIVSFIDNEKILARVQNLNIFE